MTPEKERFSKMNTINALCLEGMARSDNAVRLIDAESIDSGVFCYATQYTTSPMHQRIYVDTFFVDGQQLHLHPPLSFVLTLNVEAETHELRGENAYRDILVYGDTLVHAIEILQMEVLPILWEDCIEQDGGALSPRALEMAVDFRMRVVG